MPAATLPPVNRHLRVGHTVINIAPSVASLTGAATRAEINAGIMIQNEVQGVTGFTQSATKIDTPDWGSRIVTGIPGLVTIPDSSITLYGDLMQEDIRTELAMDDECVVIFMDNGDVEDSPMDVFKCDVASVSPNYDAQAPTLVTVTFTVNEVFQGLGIPAAA